MAGSLGSLGGMVILNDGAMLVTLGQKLQIPSVQAPEKLQYSNFKQRYQFPDLECSALNC